VRCVALVLCCALAVPGALRLQTRFDLVGLYAGRVGAQAPDPVVWVVIEDPGGLQGEAAGALAEGLRVPGVAAVAVPRLPPDLPAGVRDDLTRAAWGATDARWGAVQVTLSPDADVETVDRLASAAHASAGARRTVLVGMPVLDRAHAQVAATEIAGLVGLVGLGFALALGALFRHPGGVVLPLAAIGVGILWVAGALGWAGVALGGPLLALIPLILVLGLTDSVHLVWRMADRSHAGDPHPVRTSVREVGRAATWTSITTASGFAALTLTGAPVLQQFGQWAALGLAIAWLAGLGVPATLAALVPALIPPPPALQVPRWLERAGIALWHPASLAVLLIAATAGLARLDIDLRIGGELPADAPVVVDHRWADATLGGLHPATVRVVPTAASGTGDAAAYLDLLKVQRWLVAHPTVGSVRSFADAAQWVGRARGVSPDRLVGQERENPERRGRKLDRVRAQALALATPLTAEPLDDGRQWPVRVRLHDEGAAAWGAWRDALAALDAELPAVDLVAEGYPLLAAEARDRIALDGAGVVGLGASVGVLALALLTRRWWVVRGAVGVLLVSAAAIVLGLVVLGVPLSYTNLFLLSAVLGVGVDGWIHLTARPGEPADVLREVGPPLLAGHALLVFGLLLLGASRMATLRDAGLVLALAMTVNGVATLGAFLGRGTSGDAAVERRQFPQ
jgi:predicted RND superfamily exporter protein